VTVGGIVVTNVAGGDWFWLGFVLAVLMVAGMAGAHRRPGLSWIGGMGLLLWALVHIGALEPLVGFALVGMAAIGFLVVWLHGPVRVRHRGSGPSVPVTLSRRVG
jgi:hypothetical protein